MKLSLNLHTAVSQQTTIRSVAAVAALAATLTVASVARFGAPWDGALPGQGAGAPAARTSVAANTALARTLEGNGYVEFLVGEAAVFVEPVRTAANVALARTLTGAGFSAFPPGEGPVANASARVAAAGVGLREYLDGEDPVATLPLPVPATQPAPQFGPQP